MCIDLNNEKHSNDFKKYDEHKNHGIVNYTIVKESFRSNHFLKTYPQCT